MTDSENELLERYTIRSIEELLALEAKSIAFYGGTFDPPHHGHLSLIEGALMGPVDHVIVCVHSHSPGKQPIAIEHRLILSALNCNSSPLERFIHIASPDLIDGVQNAKFYALAARLQQNSVTPWILMGADALKPTHPEDLRRLPHIIVTREPHEAQPREILMGPVCHLENLGSSIDILVERAPRTLGFVYDPRCEAFHHVVERTSREWPKRGNRSFILFSSRIQEMGLNYLHFVSPSGAFLTDTGWKLSKTPRTFHFETGEVAWFVNPAEVE